MKIGQLKHVFIFVILFLCGNGFAQTSKFIETSDKIENLLRYKQKSPAQLRELLTELERYKFGYEADYFLLKSKVDQVLMPIDIKFARSDVYNKKYKDAIQKTKQIKLNYTYDRNIQKLEDYLDHKLYGFHKRNLLKKKPTWFSLEPSISMYSSEQNVKLITDVRNMNPIYGLGLYVKLKNTEKSNFNGKSLFRYSQLGLKMDYRDPNYTYLKDTSFTSNSPYFNTQLSFIFRKTLGFDAGLMSFSKSPGDFSSLFAITGSFYVPMRFMSIGISARVLTDFTSTNPMVQLGTTLKFNIGLYKSFSARDREEIRSQVMKYKEGK
jgi:hypothetical protein